MSKSIYLKASYEGCWWDKFLECFVFGKTEPFKNNPRVNSMMLPSFFSTLIIVACIGIFGTLLSILYALIFSKTIPEEIAYLASVINCEFCDPHKVIKWVAIPITSVWYLIFQVKVKTFREQWLYCASLYNKIHELKANMQKSTTPEPKTLQYPRSLEYLRVGLAIDLVTLDLWAHRSFRDYFKESMRQACQFVDQKKSTRENETLLDTKNLTEKKALEILEEYQESFQ